MRIKFLTDIASTSRGTVVYRVEDIDTKIIYVAKSVKSERQAEQEFNLQQRAFAAGFSPQPYAIGNQDDQYFIIMDEVIPMKRPSKLTDKQKQTLILNLYKATHILQRDDSDRNFLYGVTRIDDSPKDYMIDFGIVDVI